MADTIEMSVKLFTAVGALASAAAGVPLAAEGIERRIGSEWVSSAMWFNLPVTVALPVATFLLADNSVRNDTDFWIGSLLLFVIAAGIVCGRYAIFRPYGRRPSMRPGDRRVLFLWVLTVFGFETLWWASMIDAGVAWGMFDKLSKAISYMTHTL